MKKNKDDCIKLIENVHELLYAIVNLHMKSETPGSLSPAMLYHVGKFTEYVQSSVYLRTSRTNISNVEPATRYIPSLRCNKIETGSNTSFAKAR